MISEFSGGIPRLINVLADRAMLGAYARGVKQISAGMIEYAVADIEGVAA